MKFSKVFLHFVCNKLSSEILFFIENCETIQTKQKSLILKTPCINFKFIMNFVVNILIPRIIEQKGKTVMPASVII